jgi:nitroreductase
MELLEAVLSRTSKRDFMDKPVPKELIVQILSASLRAPSWANSQPWEIAVSTGKTSEFIKNSLYELAKNNTPINPDYPFSISRRLANANLSSTPINSDYPVPNTWPEKQEANMFETGKHRFEQLGIGREDAEKRREFALANYKFFNSQTAIFIYLEESLGVWSILDCGMLIQNILLAVHDSGLGACPQAYLVAYPDILRQAFGLPANKKFILGISIGYYKTDSKINDIKTFRNDFEDIVKFYD